MPDADRHVCEVKIDGAWQRVTAADAHAHHRSAPKRCPSCHGAVMTGSNYAPPFLVRMQHRKTHDGCPLMPALYNGTPRPHPQALT